MAGKCVLITGGAGFLGSHLCDAFSDQGDRVICVDNLITGSLANLEHLKRHPSFIMMQHDISRPIEFKDPVDYVLHFASAASPPDYMEHPIATLKAGALGTHNALGLAKAKKAVFLLASTSEIYGDPLVHPQTEDYWGNVNPVGPRSVYDEAKRFAEAMTMAYYRTHGVDAKIVRIFNTYGPRMQVRDGRAIPEFISNALHHQPLPVFGKGEQTRSFCYVDDLIRGLQKLLFSSLNEPVNLGNPNEMTILELAKLILKMTQSRSKIEYKPLPKDDPKLRRPDITKARTLLHWEPEVSLEAGLEKTIAYFKEYFRKAVKSAAG